MLLYTCAAKRAGATTPIIKHPCGRAAKALDDAGHKYDIEVVGGFKGVPLSRRGKRDEIRALTGGDDVPVLVLDDQTVVAGTSEIISWAAGHRNA